MHVAIASLPVGKGIAWHRLHLHVGGEEIVARVRTLVRDIGHKEGGVEALAHEAAVRIRELDQHRVNRACARLRVQFLKREHAGQAGQFIHAPGVPSSCGRASVVEARDHGARS